MKTICVMDSVSRANGGIFEAERRLQQSLYRRADIDVQLIGLADDHCQADLASWAPLVPRALTVRGPRAIGYAPEMASALARADADLGYVVGLWKYPSLAAHQWSKRTGRPLMIAPHGMLDPWALQNSGAKKKIAGWLFQNAQLREAKCLRALCAAEAASMRAYGLKNPICVIPNGMDLPASERQERRYLDFPLGRKVLLYLGRLHPKKGLVPLLEAWARVQPRNPEWLLAIAGWDQLGHEQELRQRAFDLGIRWSEAGAASDDEASVLFVGAQFGAAKAECYRSCDAFVLPSFSEGLPMAVLEAWAYEKPVMMTPACNLPEGFAASAALPIETGAAHLANGLRSLFALSDSALKQMGRRGRELVEARFNWERIAEQMSAVYTWMVGGGVKPACFE